MPLILKNDFQGALIFIKFHFIGRAKSFGSAGDRTGQMVQRSQRLRFHPQRRHRRGCFRPPDRYC